MSNLKRKAVDDIDTSSLRKINKKIDKIINNERSSVSLDSNLTKINEPLTQDDVVYFQKQAIFRLLNLQYQKNENLVNSLSVIRSRYSKILIYNSILIQWWFQILDSLKLLFNVDLSSIASFNDEILLSLSSFDEDSSTSNTDTDTDTAKLEANLNQLRLGLVKLINELLDKNTTTDDSNNKIVSLENDISHLTVAKSNLSNENSLLKSTVSNLNDRLEHLLKKMDRLNSKSLHRIKSDETETEPSTNGTIEDESKKTVQNQPLNVGADDSSVDKSIVEDLNVKIESLMGKNETLKNQLEEKIQIIFNLEKSISDLNSKINNLSDDELSKISKSYNDKIGENKQLLAKLDEVQLEKKKIENQLFELESKFSINKAKMEAKLKSELENNNNYIAKLENDLIRIRSDRDNLNSKISILKNEKGKSELIDTFKTLTATLQTRINELEDFQNQNLADLSTDDHNKIILNELKQIEKAFKSTRDVSISKILKISDSENLINKLSIEKSKADEKYFQAMRAKDSLSSQNKILSSNLTKQMELIEILKSNEAELLKKLSIEENLYNQLSKLESLYQNDITKLNNKNSNLEKSIASKLEIENNLRSQISKCQFEVQQLDKKYQSLQQDLSSEKKKSQSYKKLIDNYRSGSASSPTAMTATADTNPDSEIQEALLSMTKCSLCRKNFKNVAIKTCGHCFCKQCVDDRLSARMRKCPSCNSQFSRYDLLTIHL